MPRKDWQDPAHFLCWDFHSHSDFSVPGSGLELAGEVAIIKSCCA